MALFAMYIIGSSLAANRGLEAVDAMNDLNLDCVIGRRIDVHIPNEETYYVRSRDDGGLLQAETLVDRDRLRLSARGLIASQSMTVREWIDQVTDKNIALDSTGDGSLVWVYPRVVYTSIGGSRVPISIASTAVKNRIGIGSRLPAFNRRLNKETTVLFTDYGMDYCNGTDADINVWSETRDWLPFATLRLGQSGLVVATCSLATFIIFVYLSICGDDDTATVQPDPAPTTRTTPAPAPDPDSLPQTDLQAKMMVQHDAGSAPALAPAHLPGPGQAVGSASVTSYPTIEQTTDKDKEISRATALFAGVLGIATLVVVTSFYVLGGIGTVLLSRKRSRPWGSMVAENTELGQAALLVAYIGLAGFIVFALIMPMLGWMGWWLVKRSFEAMRNIRNAKALGHTSHSIGDSSTGGDPGANALALGVPSAPPALPAPPAPPALYAGGAAMMPSGSALSIDQ